ncbi:MAG TPA: FtsX-like permease family protein [Gemmataceae bacterium]|jgi:putative ABC transport system permease protein
MLSLYRTLSLRYWGRSRLRCALVLSSIAVGVAACVATCVLDANLETAFQRSATPLAGFADLYVSNGDAGVPRILAEQLAQVPGVRSAAPLVLQRVALPDLDYRPALLLGVDIKSEAEPSSWSVTTRELTGRDFSRTVIFRQKTVVIGQELEQALHRDGETVQVLIGGQTHYLRRVGVLNAQGPAAALGGNVLVLSCGDAAELLGRPDLVSRIDLTLDPQANRERVYQRVAEVLDGKARLATPDQHGRWVEEMLAGLRFGLRLCGVGALMVGLFFVANVLAVSTAERRHDIGIMKSVGALPWQIAALLGGEAAMLGLAGGILGLPLGFGLARCGLCPVQHLLSDVFLPVETGALEMKWGALLAALAAGVITALLAAIIPALKAGSVSPLESLRRLPPPPCLLGRRFHLIVVLGLLACGPSYLVMSILPFRFASFGNLVLVLLASLLATPLLTLTVARFLQRGVRRWLCTPTRLAVDNLIRSQARTGLVTTTLAAGVALFVQTSGFIASNENAIRSWVEQSLTGDLFITSGGPLSITGQNLPMGEGIRRQLEEVCPEAQVVPIRFRYLDWQRCGRPTRILLCAVDAERFYSANKDRLPQVSDLNLYQRLCEPGSALVSKNFAALYGIRAGDTIALPGADGPVSLRVLGEVEDYTCSRGTVLVDRRRYRQQFDAHLIDTFTVYLPPGADVPSVHQRLQESSLATEQAFCVLTRAALRSHILGMVLGLYRLAYVQEIMVAVVSLLAMVTALLLSVLHRRRELGLLRAVGATPQQVFRSVLAEALLMAILGTATGLVVGIPLEWYTVRILLFVETGTLLAMQFPWATAATILVLMLICAALASLAPALRTGRMRIAEAIGQE